MAGIYDQLTQALVNAPLAVQLVVVLGIAVPVCAAGALVLLRGIDLAAAGWAWLARPSPAGPEDAAGLEGTAGGPKRSPSGGSEATRK